MQGFSDELLVDLRSISVGSIDQRDAELDGAPEHHPGRFGIAGPTPYAWPTQPHGAEANSGHRPPIVRNASRRNAPLQPVMVFVNTDAKDQVLGAAFQQNS